MNKNKHTVSSGIQNISTDPTHRTLLTQLIRIISETNGISLKDTLELLSESELKDINSLAFD